MYIKLQQIRINTNTMNKNLKESVQRLFIDMVQITK